MSHCVEWGRTGNPEISAASIGIVGARQTNSPAYPKVAFFIPKNKHTKISWVFSVIKYSYCSLEKFLVDSFLPSSTSHHVSFFAFTKGWELILLHLCPKMQLKSPDRGGSSEHLERQAFLSDFAFTGHLYVAPFDIRITILYWSTLSPALCSVIVQAIQEGTVPRQAL